MGNKQKKGQLDLADSVKKKKLNGDYFVLNGYLYRSKKNDDVKLSNFQAEIIEEITEDDGIEENKTWKLKYKILDRDSGQIEIKVKEFKSLNWADKLGSSAIIYPGNNNNHLMVYIQENSSPKKTICYEHTGWRQHNDEWVYLTSNGAIGGKDISVRLVENLERYKLPLNPSEDETEAIKASLSFLDVADKSVSIPLLTLVYLSPLTSLLTPEPAFVSYLNGRTGTRKTTLAQLALSHFGEFDSKTGLSSFLDTPYYLIEQAFFLKDTLMLIDDYHPSASSRNSRKMESNAQVIIRAFANKTGRDRLNPNATLKKSKPPRGLALITGEEIVSLESTLARCFVVKMDKDSVNLKKLTELQKKHYLLRHAMASYLIWVKDNMDSIKNTFKEQRDGIRKELYKVYDPETHGQIIDQVVYLQFAWEQFLKFAFEKKIITSEEMNSHYNFGRIHFFDTGLKQAKRVKKEDPVEIFKNTINEMIEEDKVHLLKIHSNKTNGEVLGGNADKSAFLGYYDDKYYYLQDSFIIVKNYCKKGYITFPVTRNKFYELLEDSGILEKPQGIRTTVVTIDGKSERVLKLEKWKISYL